MKKLFILFIAVAGFGVSSFGQVAVGVSATATSSATIVTPITITNSGNMNFGNIAVSASGGTVVLTPAGARSTTGGLKLTTVAGTVTAAHFDITGQLNYTYAITLPSAPVVLTRATGTETMEATSFTSSPTPTGTLDGSGKQTIDVGATLTVANSQVAGTYVTGTPFTVTVNYN